MSRGRRSRALLGMPPAVGGNGPSSFGRWGGAAALLGLALGCADGGGVSGDDPAVAVEGTLSAISIFQANGPSTAYFLRTRGRFGARGDEIPLAFDAAPDL